jgi:hypothetical protein
MRTAIYLVITLLVCPFIGLLTPAITPAPTMTPTATPTAAPTATSADARVEISADKTSIRVGETVTISAVPFSIGLSIYKLHLSSGGRARVRFDNRDQAVQSTDAQFDLIAMHGEMHRATFTLQARGAGSVDVTVDVSGEVDLGKHVYSWSARSSPTLTITVNP